MANLPAYVVITPARNEAQFIELTLNAMVAQTIRPLKWVIVSDGSTDGTDEIVSRYTAEYPWIELVRMPERAERNFAGKVHAINAGCSRVTGLDYAAIVCMDGDISFEQDYFAFLLGELSKDARLGLVGTRFWEGNLTYDFRFSSVEHVSGACQMFRRACFEDIGGYRPLKSGGIDVTAVLSARAKGWLTRTFTEKSYAHHRKMGSAQYAGYRARLNIGHKDYLLGSHPAWEVFRCVYQMRRKPFVIGGLLMMSAYFWDLLRRVERTMPQDLVKLRQRDQMGRLKGFFARAVHGRLQID
ncbi:MAG: glycosyltransferase family 2 protein [Acidobacteria bacterium]|nr:MAG: glycosyltransferase family 2 protein [Acidobacteriota bacterium]